METALPASGSAAIVWAVLTEASGFGGKQQSSWSYLGEKKRTPRSVLSRIGAVGEVLGFKYAFRAPKAPVLPNQNLLEATRLWQNCHGEREKSPSVSLSAKKCVQVTPGRFSRDLEIQTSAPQLDLQSSLQLGCRLMSFWAHALPRLSAGKQGHLTKRCNLLAPGSPGRFFPTF